MMTFRALKFHVNPITPVCLSKSRLFHIHIASWHRIPYQTEPPRPPPPPPLEPQNITIENQAVGKKDTIFPAPQNDKLSSHTIYSLIHFRPAPFTKTRRGKSAIIDSHFPYVFGRNGCTSPVRSLESWKLITSSITHIPFHSINFQARLHWSSCIADDSYSTSVIQTTNV